MVTDTQLARDITVTDPFILYVMLPSSGCWAQPLLGALMQEYMSEYHDCTIEDIINRCIEGEPQIGAVGVNVDETNSCIMSMNTYDAMLTEGTLYYNIRFCALAPKDDDLIRIIINVEAQNKSTPGYSLLKRANLLLQPYDFCAKECGISEI